MTSKYASLDLSPTDTNANGDGDTWARITLKPVLSASEAAALAFVNERALDADVGFKEWMAQFAGRSDWSATVQGVTEALDDPDQHVVKAVVSEVDPEHAGAVVERTVGFIHWFYGYIRVDKVDPFRAHRPGSGSAGERELAGEGKVVDPKDVASGVAEELAREAAKVEGSVAPLSQEEMDRAR